MGEINWFPGHMARSTREIESSLKVADCVLYVLDCRAVRSCFNPKFDAMLRVPVIYVLNKADTAPVAAVNAWTDRLSTGGNAAVAIEGTSSASRKVLLAAIKRVCAPTLEKQKKRGLNAHIRAVVIGVPNTGKSTVINCLCGRSRLITGDKAGVTRAATWCRVDETLDVLDTPGTLYPKITERTVGENLAIVGSIKAEVVDVTELALALIERLDAIDTTILSARYGSAIDDGGDADDGRCEFVSAAWSKLERIASARGFRTRGGCHDTERAAAAVIDDFRKGRLGKIALELADDD